MCEKIIHVDWDGPSSLEEACELINEDSDFGVYQIYGEHLVYGSGSLLYIGMAEKQTFGKRISQEKDWERKNNPWFGKLEIYVGRLVGAKIPPDNEWTNQIKLTEKLLVFAHSPTYNSEGINSLSVENNKSLQSIHILNWGIRKSLLPEVSGLWWTTKFDSANFPLYAIYGSHKNNI